ncbi:MAG: glycosyl hydrolase family 18 protein [Xenococcaceae cyanobacterium]
MARCRSFCRYQIPDYIGVDGQKDTFSFTWDWGSESVISNFNPSEDNIDLKNFWTDYTQFEIVKEGNNTVIDLSTLNNQKIILQDVSPTQLSGDNITGVAGEFPLTNNPGNPTEPTTPALPTLSIDNVSILEGNSGTSNATFTVELSAPSDRAVTVNYATFEDTANSAQDFVAKNGTLTFAPGETSQTISVEVKGDTEIEKSENFYVQLDNGTNAEILDRQGDANIINDDRTPNTGGNSQPVVGAYYPEWAIYDRNYQVSDLPADKLTHAFYAFAKINDDGTVGVFDSYAATEKRFDGDWNTPKEFAGNFEQLNNIKAENPHLKTLISIGGWTLSGKFSDVALTDASRETFAKSAVEFMTKYGFDGIDIDWEYPVSGGLAGNTYRPEDKHNYTLLLGELDEQLQIQEAKDNQDYLLTIASPAGFDKIQNYELGAMSQYLDFFNVMAYDYHGAWENTTNHNAPLYGNPNDPSSVASQYNIDRTIQIYLSEGVPADKIVLGAPAYGRTWTGVGSDSNGLFQPATGAGQGTWESGIIDYNDLYNKLQTDSNYVRYWDDAAKVPYVYNSQTGFFSTYEDTESMGYKLDYIKENQLGGTFFWDASGDIRDSNNPESLISLAATELGIVPSQG